MGQTGLTLRPPVLIHGLIGTCRTDWQQAWMRRRDVPCTPANSPMRAVRRGSWRLPTEACRIKGEIIRDCRISIRVRRRFSATIVLHACCSRDLLLTPYRTRQSTLSALSGQISARTCTAPMIQWQSHFPLHPASLLQLVGTVGHLRHRFTRCSSPLHGSVRRTCHAAHHRMCDSSPAPISHESAPSQNEMNGSCTSASTRRRRVGTPGLIDRASRALPWHALCSETACVGYP
jgi:hypothetical protein